MITTLPLEAFVCREVMEEFFWHTSPFNLKRHAIITTVLVFSSMFFSLLTCDLGAVFELIGATSACALAYILPPLCYLKLMKGGGWRRWMAWGVVAFGGIVLAVSLVQSVWKIISGGGKEVVCHW
jgi:solute carrier family 38 (sodium-coupled neutral amino acid transporter), member 11